ncbi:MULTISPECIES: PTS lactose/cellobiose transporter subunit IIA [unclassified Gemella]|uniref:PTS lactose/cellobiose transporter subunit IIA n=1 Tax=unclassified Gemella TaxID=2624949 RepID=UPI001C03FF4B|nr:MULTISPECIES: PTS lactose/cellobiose transporter subunit IIA [unclassified Gemella]MBU0278249.1 PTS lactose/cellobiose transporter subunit IIA [Gemella sp. zg-1178]QWQ38796.1 PTS lactose/cellobiose transporter subunit IIA [Gemella sp. zg-570]
MTKNTKISMTMITYAGLAKSNFIEAIQEAKISNFESANKLLEEGISYSVQAHKEHSKLLQSFASGIDIPIDLLLIHAEDQLMNVELLKTITEEFIELYKKLL